MERPKRGPDERAQCDKAEDQLHPGAQDRPSRYGSVIWREQCLVGHSALLDSLSHAADYIFRHGAGAMNKTPVGHAKRANSA
jgi:hypothetical protein